ncbi:MAG: hypothetical protein ABI643_03540 [Candidatus Doudnabacteria bacterium]
MKNISFVLVVLVVLGLGNIAFAQALPIDEDSSDSPAVITEQVQRKIFGDTLYEQIKAENTRPVSLLPITAAPAYLPQDAASIAQQVQMKMFGPIGYAQIQAENAMQSGFSTNSPYGYGLYDEAYRRRVNGAATTGWFKLYAQGDTDFVKYLVVLRKVASTYVPVCAGGKAFRSVHEACEVPVGLNTYRFELRKGGKTRFYEEDVEIFSKFDHNHPFQYPISQDMFDSWQNAEGMKRIETWKE